MNKTNVFGAVQNSASSSSRILNFTKRLTVLTLLLLTFALGVRAADYVFLYYNSSTFHIMQHNGSGTISDASTFTYANCVWSGTSGGPFTNNGYYLYPSSSSVEAREQSSDCIISGNTISRSGNSSRYLRYNNGWTGTSNYQNATACVYVVTSNPKAWVTDALTISSTNGNSFAATGNTMLSTSATYRNAYYTLTPNSSGTAYYAVDGQVPSGTVPSTTQNASITWAPNNTSGWTLSNGVYDDGHVRINSSTGDVEYYNEYDDDTNLVVKATASASGLDDKIATYSISIEAIKVDPTSIFVTTPMTIYVGQTGIIAYTLTPNPCYDKVAYSSSNTGVASVNSSGVVTGVATGTATVTVTAKKIDGTTTSALTGTVTVTVKNKVATPEISFSPTAADNGTTATATISCSTPSYKIYYTTGINPIAPTVLSAEYTGPFIVNDGDQVRAIAVKNPADANWDDSAEGTETYVSCETTAPIISYIQSGTTATVTITAEAGATIYYTTNGSEPTTDTSTTGISPLTINNVGNCTLKAIAKNGMCRQSPIVSKEIILTGVSGGTVVLNDYEDHKWSYYSDEECPIHSLNPADVKITYYGNGTKTVTTTNDDNPTSFTADATGVKVGIDADVNTFVYYKTLERSDGSTAATPSAATGRCAYTTIPNPFSVRPTYGSGDTRWRGFYKWRVKKVSGGTIHSASTGGTTYAQGSTINAEEEIYFAPSSEYGMEVEFEALWARAYVVTTNTTSGLKSSVSYERNFVYLSTNTTLRNAALGYPVTYTTLDPSTGNGTKRTITIRDGFTCNANTKFENLTFAQYNNSAQTLTANGHDLIVGRGCSGTVNYVRGISQDITNPNYTIRLESGTYNYFSALRGYQAKGATNGTDTGSSMGGTPSIKVIFGCDYDRATSSGVTDNFVIQNGAFYGYSVSEGSGITYSENAFRAIVKSGKIGKGFTIDNSYEAKADGTFYIGNAGNRLRGCRNLLIEGGQIASIAGGIDNSANEDLNSVKIRMKGGHVRGVVYGGGARSAAYGNRSLIFTGGTVTGWIGGGCNGEPMSSGQNNEDTYGGITYGASCVYFGGNAICGGEGSDVSINGSIGGIVFGAGKGVEDNTTSGRMAKGTTVVIADNCNVQRNVYGGGNFGYAQTSTNIFVGGGTVQGGVFGGSNKNNGPVVSILMKDGTIKGGLYGGSNDTGTISDDVTMNINGGQVGTSSAPANIHGGGYGQATRVSGNVEVTLGAANQATGGVTVYGDVYGGSALGTVNSDANDHTYVTMYKGTINGSLYGGGLGSASVAANVNGPVKVEVRGGSVKATSVAGSGGVYGANNINGAPQRSVTVDIYGTDPAPAEGEYALYAVYGGGNQADYLYGNGYPTVTVHGCDNSIEYVYGGGNAAAVNATNVTIWGGNTIGNVFGGGNGTVTAANVTNGTNLKIYGGTILNVYGGSNSQGTIGGAINVKVESQAETGNSLCTMNIGSIYGGGNMAASDVGNIDIVCTGDNGRIDNVYGGANQADITGNIDLKINGGNIGNVFGGNNIKGDISGNITVTVGNDPNDCGVFQIDNVYGAGNLAPYGNESVAKGNYPVVNIYSGTVAKNVFGGGLGESAIVYGNPQVTIGDNNASHTAIVIGDVYGGGDAANVVGTPVVKVVNDCNTQIGNVYGGGNAADVSATSVTIDGGKI
ncbi:MAG: chitobiase/beta-hexosaminidase C-terminal domain-containing protein, partial [Bacteroidaceae bacterium]|nr:chitobiase/beta-hexosaminidase C-terminal domain-containing protein [Bacteroidaceae bacterium]